LVINIDLRFVVEAIAIALDRLKQSFGAVHKFDIGHYNFYMLKTKQILVRGIVLAGCVLNIVGCGQTGALYLPAQEPANTAHPSAPGQPKSPAALPSSAAN
jgi:predicted small lipoprotein YifL